MCFFIPNNRKYSPLQEREEQFNMFLMEKQSIIVEKEIEIERLKEEVAILRGDIEDASKDNN